VTATGDRNLIVADAASRLAAHIGDLLHSLEGGAIAPFLAEWPRQWRRRAPVDPCSLPVLAWLQQFVSDEDAVGRVLIAELCQAAPSLAWRQTYSEAQVGTEFLRHYGWTEIAGTAGPLVGEGLACGFLVLGAATRYPPHHHPAEELYVPLSGAAQWQQGDGPWRTVRPGTVIRHASGEAHSMRTGAQPLLALYLWRGSLEAKSAMLD
jgi:mannose-6-phosphate isomerase-like protein (cupin superfamily)